MLALVLALGSSLCGGCADFIAGLQNRHHRLVTVMFVSQAIALLAALVVVIATGSSLNGGSWVFFAVLAGASIGLALACLYRGLAVGTMMIVAPISACGAVVPVVVSIARGEAPGAIPLAGICLAFAGIGLATMQPVEERRSGVPAGVPLALLSACGFGGFFLALDSAAESDPLSAVLVTRISLVGLLALAALVVRAPVTVRAAELPPLAAVGLLDLGAVSTYALATNEGSLSVVSVLASFPPLVTVLLARAFLDERISRTQTMGVAATLFGIMMIAVG